MSYITLPGRRVALQGSHEEANGASEIQHRRFAQVAATALL